jgi:hypothetical protein
MNHKSISKTILAVCLVAISLVGYSQSIDTTKYYVITNVVMGEGKAVTGMVNATLGNAVMLRSAIEHPMQQWIMEQGKSGYRIYCREHGRGYSLEVVNEGSKSTKVSLGKTVDGAANQVWRIGKNPDGSYRIVSLWQEKAIDYIKTGDQANKLTLTEIESSIKSQTWRLVGIARPKTVKPAEVYTAPVNTGIPAMDTAAVYKLTCQFRGSGFAMEAVSDANGNIKPMLREAKVSAAQQWKFKFYNTDGGIYRLVNSAYADRSLDIINDGKQNTSLTLANTGHYSGQYWRVVKNVDNSYWFISYWQRAQAIDVVNAGNKDELIMNKADRYSGQLWTFTKETPATTEIVNQPVVEETVSNKDKLMPGEQLKENQKIISANGEYNLVQQADGNLVIYNSSQEAVWASGMDGKNAKRTLMQQNGSLTQHPGGYDLVIWSTQTDGNTGAYAMLQDDGVLVIVNQNNQIIWQSASSKQTESQAPVSNNKNKLMPGEQLKENQKIISVNGQYSLVQQADGNLVIYNASQEAVWASGMNGQNVARCVMQPNGDLVQHPGGYDLSMWSTQTRGNNGAYAQLQDDGILVIINTQNEVIWRSK